MSFQAKILLAFLTLGATLSAQITVLNGASNRLEQPLAAGSWATAYGDFTGVEQATAPSFPLPNSLGGVRVTVAGVEAPVYFVNASQVNFLIPGATATGLQEVVVITGGGNRTGSVRVMTAAPGIFLKDQGAPPRGAILNQNNSVNSETNPALRGEVIQIFGTGPGALSGVPQDGAAPGAGFNTVSTPEVYIGGVKVPVAFSGLNSLAPGLWQVNATIPASLTVTGRVPVSIYMDGVDSNEVSVIVQ